MRIKELTQDHVARPLWGFVPGREVKPVHFTNKFFRALSGQEGSPKLVHDATGRNMPGSGHLASAALLNENPNRFADTTSPRAIERADELRAILRLVLNQDKAVYGGRTYSFTVTHRGLTSPDPSDQGTGAFLAQVLAAGANNSASAMLRDALDDSNDPITSLVVPLLPEGSIGPAPEPPQADSPIRSIVTASMSLRYLQDAFSRLAAHAPQLHKVELLRRSATLGAFGLVHHVLNSTDAARGGRFVPLLVAARDPHSEVREASRASLRHALRQIGEAFAEELSRLLHRRGEDGRDEDYYRGLMNDWLDDSDMPKRDATKVAAARDRFNNDYRLELAGTSDAFEAFLHAAVPAAFGVIGANSPERFVHYLGTHAGFLFPRQGGGAKYVRPEAPFYDTLLSSLLEPGEEIATGEMWERARIQFGLVVGSDPYTDAKYLADNGIRLASERSLAMNAQMLDRQLEELGHARRFADGFTLIRAVN